MKIKINLPSILLGLIALIAAILVMSYTYKSLRILKYGDLVYCPVVHIDYSAKGGNHAVVLLNGRQLSAGKTSFSVQLNDTIAVMYIDGETRVVQAENRIEGYYFFFLLEGILFIMGLVMMIGGFMGKSIYDSYTPKKNRRNKKLKHR